MYTINAPERDRDEVLPGHSETGHERRTSSVQCAKRLHRRYVADFTGRHDIRTFDTLEQIAYMAKGIAETQRCQPCLVNL